MPDLRRIALTVLALTFAMNMLARGVGETYAVFLLPLGAEFGWTRSELTSVYSVFMLVLGLGAPLSGLVFDRYGPRASYALGLGALGGGCFAAGRLDALWQFHLCIGLLGGLGATMLGMVAASGLVSRWFRARLGTAMGVTLAGLGTGVMLIVPLAQVLVDAFGWRGAYTWIGGALLALLPVALALPWRRIGAGHPEIAAGFAAAQRHASGWTLRRAVRDRAFWGLFGVFFFTAVSIYAVSVQAVAYLVEIGFAPIEAATAFGLLGILSTGGMVLAGWLTDRIGSRPSVVLSYSLTVTGIALLYLLSHAPAIWLLAPFVLCFGVSQGSRGPVISTLTARLFPGGRIGAIYGCIATGMGLGAAVGSWGSGLLYDASGGYVAGFAFATAAAGCGLAQFWIAPALARGRRA